MCTQWSASANYHVGGNVVGGYSHVTYHAPYHTIPFHTLTEKPPFPTSYPPQVAVLSSAGDGGGGSSSPLDNSGPARKSNRKQPTDVIPCMYEWGLTHEEDWNDECEASDCDVDEDEDVMMCYSCNLVMHPACADGKQQNSSRGINDEWLCPECFEVYESKQLG
jgi:hypothetical protein